MFSFRPISAVLSALPVHTPVGFFFSFFFFVEQSWPKRRQLQPRGSVGRGSQWRDKEMLTWACVRRCVAETSPVFLPVKTHLPEEHVWRINRRVAVRLLAPLATLSLYPVSKFSLKYLSDKTNHSPVLKNNSLDMNLCENVNAFKGKYEH